MAQSTELRFKLIPELDTAKVNEMLAALKSSMSTGAPLTIPGTDKAGDSLKNVKDKAKETGDELDKLKNKGGDGNFFSGIAKSAFEFNNVSQAVQNIGAGLNEFGGGFVALDTAVAKVRTLGEESAKIAPDIRQAAIDMSKELPFSAADFAGAMGDAMASGVKGGAAELSQFSEIAAKLAVGGDADLGAVVKGLGANLNAFGKTAADSSKFADILFNTVNAGVTTIDELNQYLSGVTPTAAAAGLSFENVGASLALMTQKGVPTAQATTKLNALLLEIQKPGKALSDTFAQAGLSTEKLGEVMKNEGLPAALDLVQKAFEKTGKSATQAFSSSEAGAAFNILQGEAGQFQKFLEDVGTTTGSTQFAYEQMADTVEVRQKQINSQIEAFKTQALSAFPTGSAYALTFAQTLGSVAPQLTSLGALAPMLKSVGGGFLDLGKSLLTKFAPQLVAMSATGSISFASLGTAGTTALGAITAAIAANPIGAILVGLTALGVGIAATYAILSKTTKEQAEEDLKGAEAAKKNTETQIAQNKEREKGLNGTKSLVKEYQELASKSTRTADEQSRLRTITQQLDKQYPSLIDQTKSFKDNLSGVAEIGKITNAELEKTAKRGTELQKQLNENVKAIATARRNVAVGELQDSLGSVDAAFILSLGLAGAEVQKFKSGWAAARGEFEKGLYGSKTLEELDNVESKILEFLNANAKLLGDSEKEVELREGVAKAIAAQRAALQAYGLVAKDTNDKENKSSTAPPPKNTEAKKKTTKETNDLLKEQLALLDSLRKKGDEDFKADIERNAILEERSVSTREQLDIELKKEKSLIAQLATLEEAIKAGKLTVTTEAKPLTDADKTRLEKNMAGLTKVLGTIDIKAKPEDAAAINTKITRFKEALDKGVSGGTVSVPIKSVADRESVTDAIEKIRESIDAVENPQRTIKAKITIEDIKETRRTLEQRAAELRADITARIVPLPAARQELISILDKQIGDLQLRLKATADPATRETLQEAIKKLQSEVADTNTVIIRDQYIATAPNAAAAQLRRMNQDAETAYAARLALSSRSADEEFADFNDYLNKKLEAENIYIQKSRTANESALADLSTNLAANLKSVFDDAFAVTDDQKRASQEREDQLQSEESSIRRSYDRRIINQVQFYDKMRELDEKRVQQQREAANQQASILQVVATAVDKSLETTRTNALAQLATTAQDVNKYAALQVDFRDRIAQADNKLALITDQNSAEYKQALNEKKVAMESLTQSTIAGTEANNKAWALTAQTIGASLGQAIASGKNLLKTMVVSALDALNALVPILSAQLLAVLISSPNPINVATLGAGGLAAYAGLNALLIATVQGAKALALSAYETGGHVKGGRQIIQVNEAGEEYVVNAKATKKNLRALDIINRDNITIEQYAAKYLGYDDRISAKAVQFTRETASNAGIESRLQEQTAILQKELQEQKKVLNKVAARFSSDNRVDVKVKVESKDHYVY